MLQNKIILLKDSQMIKIKTKPNTDNMGKLFHAFLLKKREHNLPILPGR
jgi:hypothetical protein